MNLLPPNSYQKVEKAVFDEWLKKNNANVTKQHVADKHFVYNNEASTVVAQQKGDNYYIPVPKVTKKVED